MQYLDTKQCSQEEEASLLPQLRCTGDPNSRRRRGENICAMSLLSSNTYHHMWPCQAEASLKTLEHSEQCGTQHTPATGLIKDDLQADHWRLTAVCLWNTCKHYSSGSPNTCGPCVDHMGVGSLKHYRKVESTWFVSSKGIQE